MSTVIYLANRIIQIVRGSSGDKVSVLESYEVETPEGMLINGVIMDTDAFIEFIGDIWKKYGLEKKGVTLVINSSRFVGQIIELPAMSDNDTLGYITREYSDIDKGADRVYGFMRLKGSAGKLNRIYAESIDPGYIKEYSNIYALAGIIVERIYSGEGSMIGLINHTVARDYSNFILVIAGCMTITSILYIDGRNTYYNQVRCFHDKNSEEHISEVARSVSQIKQFMQANGFGDNLERVFISGVNEENILSYRDAIKDYGTTADVTMFEYDSYISGNGARAARQLPFAVSGLFSNKGRNNYLKAAVIKRNVTAAKQNLKYILPIVIAAAVMLIAFVSSVIYERSKQSELESLQNSLKANADQLQVYDSKAEENASLAAKYLNLLEQSENIYTYPIADSEIAAEIKSLLNDVEITIAGFDAMDGKLAIHAKTKVNEKLSLFAMLLEQKEYVKEVDYKGYSSSGDGYFLADMTCIISGDTQRKAVVYDE